MSTDLQHTTRRLRLEYGIIFLIVLGIGMRLANGRATAAGPQQDDARVLHYGDTVDGTLHPTHNLWTFTGKAADVITLEMESEQIDCYLELYDPLGEWLTSSDDEGEGYNARIFAFTLPMDGEYQVLADSMPRGGSGAFRLTLRQESLSLPRTLTYGEQVVARLNITENATGDDWTFDGKAGEVITVTMNSDALDAYLEIYDSAGNRLMVDDDGGRDYENGLFNARISAFRLPTDDTYTLRASQSYRGSGVYVLTLRLADVVEQGALALGEAVTGELSSVDGDSWTLSVETDQPLFFDVVSLTVEPILTIYTPDGELVIEARPELYFQRTQALLARMPSAGDYRLMVRTASGKTGDYTLRVQALAMQGVLVEGEPQTATLANSLGDLWAFEAARGDTISINVESDEFDMFLTLHDPAGVWIASDDDSGEGRNATLRNWEIEQSGTYIVLIRSYDAAGTGVYTVRLDN